MGEIYRFEKKSRWKGSPALAGLARASSHGGFAALALLVAGGIYLSGVWQPAAPDRSGAGREDKLAEVVVDNRVIRHAAGPAYSAIDGDSLRTSREDIRLLGIDAPELYQTCRDVHGRPWACGREAHAKLRALVGRGDVRCTSTGRDRFNRAIALCSAGTVADVGEVMVREGFAVNFMNGRYARAESEARRARRGIWAGEFERPQEWRRRNPRGDRG